MTTDACWFLPLLLLSLVWLAWARQHRRRLQDQGITDPSTGQRCLKPRTPDDCAACCQHRASPVGPAPLGAAVTPWREYKSRRGAPKRIPTEGFACPNRRCSYYRITDTHIHALVGDGTHGKTESIQTFRCQACRTTFSARLHTPLYRLKTPTQRVGEVLSALAQGLDVSSAVRVFGHRHATITTWLTRAGEHSTLVHDHWFHNLQLPHLQLDEVRTRLRSRTRVLWLWLVMDPITKIIPVLHLGSRTQATANIVVHDVQQRLAPDCLPVFMSDGLRLYFYALTAHFGQWVDRRGRRQQWQVAPRLIYGQVKKVYRRRKVVRVTHLLRCGTRMELTSALQALRLSGRINTAFVERVNLTVRQSVAALIRRTWSTAQAAPQLLAHLEWWRG